MNSIGDMPMLYIINHYQLKNLLRIVVILIAVLLPHYLPLPFNLYSLIIIAIVWLFLKYDRTSFTDIGFSISRFKKQALLYGVLVAFLIVGFTQLVSLPLIDLFFTFPETQVEMYDKLDGNTGFYIIMLIMGWVIGGLYEEVVFHGFIFFQLKQIIDGKYKTQISFILTSIIFGLYHLQLGPADTINAFLVGAAYHLLVLQFKGNLWYSIICHGAYNSIVITLLYLGYI
jgi:membrane protease YdiL (CAAX protease family)